MYCSARIALTLPALLVLSACAASSADYPTLEIRDFERQTRAVGTVNADPPAEPASPEYARFLMEKERAAASAHRNFMNEVADVRRKVARASRARTDSEIYGDAQVALSDLDAKRSLTAVILGDLDLVYADQAIALERQSNMDAARDRVTQILREQDMILRDLRNQL